MRLGVVTLNFAILRDQKEHTMSGKGDKRRRSDGSADAYRDEHDRIFDDYDVRQARIDTLMAMLDKGLTTSEISAILEDQGL